MANRPNSAAREPQALSGPLGLSTYRKRRNQGRVRSREGGRCYVCRAPVEDVHHLEPMAAGGSNDLTNLVAVCKPCHQDLHRVAKRGVLWLVGRVSERAARVAIQELQGPVERTDEKTPTEEQETGTAPSWGATEPSADRALGRARTWRPPGVPPRDLTGLALRGGVGLSDSMGGGVAATRLTAGELAVVRRMAQSYGITISACLRGLVRRGLGLLPVED